MWTIFVFKNAEHKPSLFAFDIMGLRMATGRVEPRTAFHSQQWRSGFLSTCYFQHRGGRWWEEETLVPRRASTLCLSQSAGCWAPAKSGRGGLGDDGVSDSAFATSISDGFSSGCSRNPILKSARGLCLQGTGRIKCSIRRKWRSCFLGYLRNQWQLPADLNEFNQLLEP